MWSDDRLRAILDLVQDSLDEPDLSGEDLAGRAFLSRFHFDRLVAAAIGEPPGTFRRRVLLERAAHRLLAGEPVIDVAFGAGYRSPEAFARAFKRAHGVTPSQCRSSIGFGCALPGMSGIHFHPPGSLRLPALTRSHSMDVLIAMFEHHISLAAQIIERAEQLDDATLDRPIELSVEGIDLDPTLRSLAARLVSQLEMWVTAIDGGTRMPADGDCSPPALRRRLTEVAPAFRQRVLTPVEEGRADETFIDAVCDPPETFTFGGVLAHVLTFSAARRTLAVGALETAGIGDLGAGDPMKFVGGWGHDASTISRRASGVDYPPEVRRD